MANFFKTAKISTAVHKQKNKFDLSCNTLTTQDFYALKPVYRREMNPGESLTVNMDMFVRLNSMEKPIMANSRVVNRAFFVPYRIVMNGFDEFISQTPYTKTNGQQIIIPSVLAVTNNILQSAFNTPSYGFVIDMGDDPQEVQEDYDFAYGNTEFHYYKLTDVGRFAYDILISLGYKIIFKQAGIDYPTNLKYSALPLLCYAKVWYDWYRNPAYADGYFLNEMFKREPSAGNDFVLTVSELVQLLKYCYKVQYDSDYFTSQWDNPTGPNNINSITNFNAVDATLPDVNIVNKSKVTNANSNYSKNGTPTILRGDGNGQVTSLSQYIIDSLKRVTDFVHRRQMVGNRTIDSFLSLFGVENRYEKSLRSQVLGHWDNVVSIGEVIATTSAGATQDLGDFAGKGVCVGRNMKFNYECIDDHGMILILSYIEPRIGYCDGIDRHLFDLAPLDFYQGDFDTLGVQATYSAEIWADQNREDLYAYGDGGNPDSIFGYMPRYAHMKCAQDSLSGMFMRPMYKNSMRQWHFFRNFDDLIKSQSMPPHHNYDFTIGEASKYNHIFAVNDGQTDNFTTAFHFTVTKYSPMTPLWNNYEFEHEEEHKQVIQSINGAVISD